MRFIFVLNDMANFYCSDNFSNTQLCGIILQTRESLPQKSHTSCELHKNALQLKFSHRNECAEAKFLEEINLFHCQCQNKIRAACGISHEFPHPTNYRCHYSQICKVNNWCSCNHSLLQRAQRKRQKFPLSMINCGINAITNVYYPEWKKEEKFILMAS